MAVTDDGFYFTPPPKGKPYLGDSSVVHGLISAFANDVMAEYHKYLAALPGGMDAQVKIAAMAKRYGDIFMGRNPNYAPAPWHCPARMGGKLRFAVASIKGDDDPGEGFFRALAVDCCQASKAMADGMSEEEAGPRLQEILEDAAKWMLGVNL